MIYLEPTVMCFFYLPLSIIIYHPPSLLAHVFCYLFQKSALVVENVERTLKASFYRSCNYTSTFKYWIMRTLWCYTSTNIIYEYDLFMVSEP